MIPHLYEIDFLAYFQMNLYIEKSHMDNPRINCIYE